MMMNKIIKKRHAVFATYPIAVLVFFIFLVGVTLYVQTFKEHLAGQIMSVAQPVDDMQKQIYFAQLRRDYLTHVPLQRVIYQPVKKSTFSDLVVENAHAGIILDANTQNILWEKNATEQRSIASMTKLVTAMVVIDRVRDLDEIVTIPESVISIEGTKVGCPTSVICTGNRLEAGEKVHVRDLLYAMLMFSANDAATALGIHIAGSEEAFADLMNARMKELGAYDSHFCRPSGLELDENEEMCYSSAYDIARVMAHLLVYEKYDVLWDMMRTQERVFTSIDGSITHEVDNTDRLIGDMTNLDGAKTGFTPRAGYCLALSAHDVTGQHHVIAVVLDDVYRFDDVQYMSQWAFDNYIWQ